MIFLTSINPNSDHKSTINSWFDYGSVVSFNTKNEIDYLKSTHRNVAFVTINYKYCPIQVILKNTEYGKNYCIINDDILISNSSFLKVVSNLTDNSVVIGKRWNYDDNVCFRDPWGIDIVAFRGDLARNISIPIEFRLGKPWWDYQLPYSFLKSGIKVKTFNDKCLLHKTHNNRWSNEEWINLCMVFLKTNGIRIPKASPQEISEQTNIVVHREIYEKQKTI